MWIWRSYSVKLKKGTYLCWKRERTSVGILTKKLQLAKVKMTLCFICKLTIGSCVSCAFIEIWSTVTLEIWRARKTRKSCSRRRKCRWKLYSIFAWRKRREQRMLNKTTVSNNRSVYKYYKAAVIENWKNSKQAWIGSYDLDRIGARVTSQIS